MTLPTPDLTRLAGRQAHLIRLVRRGVPVQDAAAAVYVSVKSVQHWRAGLRRAARPGPP